MRNAAMLPPAYPPSIGDGRLLTEDELAASLAHTMRDWDAGRISGCSAMAR